MASIWIDGKQYLTCDYLTVAHDLTVGGDFLLQGGGSMSFDQIIQGSLQVQGTAVVRKLGAGTFKIPTGYSHYLKGTSYHTRAMGTFSGRSWLTGSFAGRTSGTMTGRAWLRGTFEGVILGTISVHLPGTFDGRSWTRGSFNGYGSFNPLVAQTARMRGALVGSYGSFTRMAVGGSAFIRYAWGSVGSYTRMVGGGGSVSVSRIGSIERLWGSFRATDRKGSLTFVIKPAGTAQGRIGMGRNIYLGSLIDAVHMWSTGAEFRLRQSFGQVTRLWVDQAVLNVSKGNFGSPFPAAMSVTPGSSNKIGLEVWGTKSQTANIFKVYRNSAGSLCLTVGTQYYMRAYGTAMLNRVAGTAYFNRAGGTFQGRFYGTLTSKIAGTLKWNAAAVIGTIYAKHAGTMVARAYSPNNRTLEVAADHSREFVSIGSAMAAIGGAKYPASAENNRYSIVVYPTVNSGGSYSVLHEKNPIAAKDYTSITVLGGASGLKVLCDNDADGIQCGHISEYHGLNVQRLGTSSAGKAAFRMSNYKVTDLYACKFENFDIGAAIYCGTNIRPPLLSEFKVNGGAGSAVIRVGSHSIAVVRGLNITDQAYYKVGVHGIGSSAVQVQNFYINAGKLGTIQRAFWMQGSATMDIGPGLCYFARKGVDVSKGAVNFAGGPVFRLNRFGLRVGSTGFAEGRVIFDLSGSYDIKGAGSCVISINADYDITKVSVTKAMNFKVNYQQFTDCYQPVNGNTFMLGNFTALQTGKLSTYVAGALKVGGMMNQRLQFTSTQKGRMGTVDVYGTIFYSNVGSYVSGVERVTVYGSWGVTTNRWFGSLTCYGTKQALRGTVTAYREDGFDNILTGFMVRRVNFTFNASNNNNVVRPRVWKWSRQTGLQQLMGTVFTNTIPNGADFTYRRDGLLTAVDSSKSGSVAREWIAIWLGSVAAIAKARYRLAIAVE